MPRVQAGILIAAPGPIPSPSICILTGQGAPSVQKPDVTQDNVANCQLGSLFIDYQGAAIYIKNGVSTGTNPNGVWSQLT
jgi:hypothetical protein